MNGVLLPLDLNTDPTFTQLLNSQFAKSVSLADGILPARYGYRTAGVVEIKTKDGCDGGDNWFQIYGGQRDTVRPSFQLQGCERQIQLLPDRPLSAVESRVQLRRGRSRPDSRRDKRRPGIHLSDVSARLHWRNSA